MVSLPPKLGKITNVKIFVGKNYSFYSTVHKSGMREGEREIYVNETSRQAL